MTPKRTWSAFEADNYLDHNIPPTDNAADAIWQSNAGEEPQTAAILSAGSANDAGQDVCFGNITGVKGLLKGNPAEFRGPSTDSTSVLDIRDVGSYFGLYFEHGLIAVLSKKTCELISKLKEVRMQHCQAIVTSEQWTAAVQEWTDRRPLPVMEFELVIYGSKFDADGVGDALSEFEITLQPPIIDLNGTEYYNPHYLIISRSSEEDILCHEHATTDHPSAQGLDEMTSENIDVSVEVNRILDSLSHKGMLREQLADGRIKSQLLPHQRIAIDFVFRTETGSLPLNLSMWRRVELGEDSHYQHIISGSKSEHPQEAKGGIIADEMGLGKSLVVLSVIAGSSERSAKHAMSGNMDTKIKDTFRFKATLVVVPSSLLIDNWIAEFRKHIYPGNLIFYTYHGHKRKDSLQELRQSDIVFTTYATIAAEARQKSNPLASIHWFRIVLDEAHDIRNRTTQQFRALRSLRAEHRWCLTGTPIQNSLEDLGSLVTFLRVPVFENSATFRHFISNQCKSTSRQSFQALKTLLSTICLRRTREVINLPEPIQYKRVLELTETEREQYNDIIEDSRQIIQMAVSMRGRMRHNTAVLQSLLRLRLFCNNGRADSTQATNTKGIPTDPDELLTYLQQTDDAVCVFCHRNIYNIVQEHDVDSDSGIQIKECMHLVCGSCVPQYSERRSQCPDCSSQGQEDIENDENGISLQRKEYNLGSDLAYPTKLRVFLQDLQHDFRSFGRSHKSIAFSSWKKTLDLASNLLSANGIRSYCIHGSLPVSERAKILKDFHSPLGANVLLMTLGTGGVGLNLANATRIYLLEPQWNPSIELQAIGRAFRLGQDQQVRIIRYIMKGTIEDTNVLQRQERKLQLANGGFSQKPKKLSSERAGILSGIFGVDLRN